MEVSRLPISATLRGKLIAAGLSTLSSLSSISSAQLALDLNISAREASEILNAASSAYCLSQHTSIPPPGNPSFFDSSQNAWDLLQEESNMTRITTSCSDLDTILEGGLCCKEVTEIGGVPGIGKTQFGIQLALNVQIPSHMGGLGGRAVYIDTEGSFMVERVIQMAEACLQDLKEHNQSVHNTSALKLPVTSEDMLENIYFFRVCSYTEQIALVNYLEKFLTDHKDVRIVIFDSITFHFRQEFDDMALRTRILTGISLKLMKIARNFNLAVVMLNQVTVKYSEGSFQLALALGDSWSHCCTNRIILYWSGNERLAYIDKSPSLKSQTASYCITGGGIRNSPCSRKRIRTM